MHRVQIAVEESEVIKPFQRALAENLLDRLVLALDRRDVDMNAGIVLIGERLDATAELIAIPATGTLWLGPSSTTRLGRGVRFSRVL
jgi:hypothetical protein